MILPPNELRFAISDRIQDVELSPARVPLALLGEFQKDVSDFLKGSGKDVDPAQVHVSIEEGSLALRTENLSGAQTLWADLNSLNLPDALNRIDAKRAAVIERWQSAAKSNPARSYIVANTDKIPFFSVNNTTDFRLAQDIWVNVEKYLHGKIVDWGGKTKPNVHLELATGKTLTIESSQHLIAEEQQNLVYKLALLHVTAEESLVTGDLRNLRLLAIESHQPEYDENEFNQMVERGTKAWSDVGNVADWLESLRGNH